MQNHPILFYLIKMGLKPAKPFLRFAKRMYDKYKDLVPDSTYHSWSSQNEEMCFADKELEYRPLITVISPTFNTPKTHLLEMVYSVVNQHYQNWELILVNASTDADAKSTIDDCSQIDTRIKIVDPGGNKGISANTNFGIKHAKGDYIAFLDHDDLLHPCALHMVVQRLKATVMPGIIYTDEDKITADGSRYFEPLCKPGLSPDLLENVNYINHLTVIRRDLVHKVGGLRPACDGAQDYDLLLRIIDECKPTIKHISHVLYHWRAASTSTASDITTKDYIFKAGTKAVKDHLARINISAKVSAIQGRPGFYELTNKKTPYSIVIGPITRTNQNACALWLDELLGDVEKEDIELIIGKWYEKFSKKAYSRPTTKFIESTDSGYWHEVAEKITKPVAVCFKLAALPIVEGKGLSQLAAVAADKRHTAVAPIIVGEDRTILDAGIIGSLYSPKHIFESYKLGKNTYFGSTEWVRNVSDLTTNIVAADSRYFQMLFYSGRSYSRTSSLRHLAKSIFPDEEPNFVVWTHTPFEYKGLLRAAGEDLYHNIQLFRFTPVVTMHVDNWGEGYERAEQ